MDQTISAGHFIAFVGEKSAELLTGQQADKFIPAAGIQPREGRARIGPLEHCAVVTNLHNKQSIRRQKFRRVRHDALYQCKTIAPARQCNFWLVTIFVP